MGQVRPGPGGGPAPWGGGPAPWKVGGLAPVWADNFNLRYLTKKVKGKTELSSEQNLNQRSIIRHQDPVFVFRDNA